jgi:hypothetical protein
VRLQQARAPVRGADHALHQALGLQPVDHAADGGAVEADGGRQAGLVDAGLLGNGIERGELHRRQVDADGLHLRLEHLGRLLVQPPDQVPGHRDPVHRCVRLGWPNWPTGRCFASGLTILMHVCI